MALSVPASPDLAPRPSDLGHHVGGPQRAANEACEPRICEENREEVAHGRQAQNLPVVGAVVPIHGAAWSRPNPGVLCDSVVITELGKGRGNRRPQAAIGQAR